jgi:hypothetical protein
MTDRKTSSVPTDTPQGVSRGGGGETGPKPELQKRVVSGDRNSGDPERRLPAGKEPRSL